MICNVHENNAMSSSFDSSLKTCYFANAVCSSFSSPSQQPMYLGVVYSMGDSGLCI